MRRRFLAVILSPILLSLVVAGCSQQEPTEQTSQEQVSLQQGAPQTEPQVADAVPDADALATLERWRVLAERGDADAAEGQRDADRGGSQFALDEDGQQRLHHRDAHRRNDLPQPEHDELSCDDALLHPTPEQGSAYHPAWGSDVRRMERQDLVTRPQTQWNRMRR